jgi:hypothetical protein
LVWQAFLQEEKKDACYLASIFFFSTRKLPHNKFLSEGEEKSSASAQSFRALQFLQRMQLQIQYKPANLRPQVYLLYFKNLVKSMPTRLQDVIRREGKPTKY